MDGVGDVLFAPCAILEAKEDHAICRSVLGTTYGNILSAKENDKKSLLSNLATHKSNG